MERRFSWILKQILEDSQDCYQVRSMPIRKKNDQEGGWVDWRRLIEIVWKRANTDNENKQNCILRQFHFSFLVDKEVKRTHCVDRIYKRHISNKGIHAYYKVKRNDYTQWSCKSCNKENRQNEKKSIALNNRVQRQQRMGDYRKLAHQILTTELEIWARMEVQQHKKKNKKTPFILYGAPTDKANPIQ